MPNGRVEGGVMKKTMNLPVKVHSVVYDQVIGEVRVPELERYPVSTLLIGRTSCMACHNAARVMENAASIASPNVGFGVLTLDDGNMQAVTDAIAVMKRVGHEMKFVPYFVSLQHGIVERRQLGINSPMSPATVENIFSGIGYGVVVTPIRRQGAGNKRRRTDDAERGSATFSMHEQGQRFDSEGNFIVG